MQNFVSIEYSIAGRWKKICLEVSHRSLARSKILHRSTCPSFAQKWKWKVKSSRLPAEKYLQQIRKLSTVGTLNFNIKRFTYAQHAKDTDQKLMKIQTMQVEKLPPNLASLMNLLTRMSWALNNSSEKYAIQSGGSRRDRQIPDRATRPSGQKAAQSRRLCQAGSRFSHASQLYFV